jgi:Na+/glutamate symporter
MKYEIAVVLLWAIAMAATYLIIRQSSVLTLLAPLFAVCMIGSVIIVRRAASSSRPPAA